MPRWRIGKYALPGIATVLTLVATMLYFVQSVYQQERTAREAEMLQRESDLFVTDIQKQLDNVEVERQSYQRTLDQLSEHLKHSGPNQDIVVLEQQITSVKNQLSAVQASLNTLNLALESSPEKALTLPLLRKDLDDFKVSNQRDLETLRGETTRSYDETKWLIGLILAAVIGMIVNNLLQTRSSNKQPQHRFE